MKIHKDLKALYVVNNKNPAHIYHNLTRYGIKNVNIMDCFSGLMCAYSEYNCVRDPHDIENIYNKLSSLVEEQKFDVIMFDSLTMFYDQLGLETTREFVKNVSDLAVAYKFTPLFLFTNWYEGEVELERLRDLFDYIIDLKLHRRKFSGNGTIKISKARGKSTNATKMPYDFVEI